MALVTHSKQTLPHTARKKTFYISMHDANKSSCEKKDKQKKQNKTKVVCITQDECKFTTHFGAHGNRNGNPVQRIDKLVILLKANPAN